MTPKKHKNTSKTNNNNFHKPRRHPNHRCQPTLANPRPVRGKRKRKKKQTQQQTRTTTATTNEKGRTKCVSRIICYQFLLFSDESPINPENGVSNFVPFWIRIFTIFFFFFRSARNTGQSAGNFWKPSHMWDMRPQNA